MTNWYDAVYGDDPSTDNIFGREALAERRDPLLHDYLRRGGRLSQFRAGMTVLEPGPDNAASSFFGD